jgi:ribosome-binding factor A
MQNRRLERVRELLKRELSVLLLREYPAKDAGMVSVSDVDLAGDLQSATVYVSVSGTPDQRKRIHEDLVQNRKRLQELLGHAVVLRYTPVLRFELDNSLERGDRILRILADIEKDLPPA